MAEACRSKLQTSEVEYPAVAIKAAIREAVGTLLAVRCFSHVFEGF